MTGLAVLWPLMAASTIALQITNKQTDRQTDRYEGTLHKSPLCGGGSIK